ncbi:MAG: diaminopimelate epimerase [Desulfobacteraceae bacterium]|nr:diaminopimelate epimerase [Desulfobacteraceae bacterium]
MCTITMPISFKKMHGSGNDFILIDNRSGIIRPEDGPCLAKRLSRRRFSVGADGLILVENSVTADFKWRFFNADGSEAEMCGNGGRCAARFATIIGAAPAKLNFETKAGIIHAEVNKQLVKLELPGPIGMLFDIPIEVNGLKMQVHFINTGVPHAVILADDIERIDVKQIGRSIRFHERFRPQGTNVDFVEVEGADVIVRTYERGVEDETLACGTGSVASAIIAAAKAGVAKRPVTVKTRGGESLNIYFDLCGQEASNIFLEGEAALVYSGVIDGDVF